MDMPGRFPDDPYIFELDAGPSGHELPASTTLADRPPEDRSISELDAGPPAYEFPSSKSSAENDAVPLSFKASPVEWHLPTTPPEEESKNQTDNSGRRPSAGRRRSSYATRSSPSAKPFAIAVFGLTGTGKSSFINTLTGKQVGIGHGLESCE